MGDPVPSSAISDATTGGLSVIVITGGSEGDVLTRQSNGTYAPETPSAGGSGDVVGPSASTDNTAVRYDGTTGKLVKASTLVINDDGTVLAAAANIGSGAFVSTITNTNSSSGFPVRNGLRIVINGSGQSGESSASRYLQIEAYGNTVFFVSASGSLTCGTIACGSVVSTGAVNGVRSTLTNNNAAFVVSTVIGAASQSANLQEWKNSSGTVLVSIDPYGWITGELLVGSGKRIFGVNGNITLATHTGAGTFNLLRFGGTGSGVPAIKISGVTLIARLADDSADTNFRAAKLNLSNLPTSDPAVAGDVWNDGGTLKISAG